MSLHKCVHTYICIPMIHTCVRTFVCTHIRSFSVSDECFNESKVVLF